VSRAARVAKLEEEMKQRPTRIVIKPADYARPATPKDAQPVGAIDRPHCPKCDARVADGARYCGSCGEALR
jgi:hypothetical protein